jgi:hypothetical protein
MPQPGDGAGEGRLVTIPLETQHDPLEAAALDLERDVR